MLKQAGLAAALCVAVGAGWALADDAPPQFMKVLDQDQIVTPFNVTVGELESADIYSAGGEEIGDVEDVLMNANGEIVALSAEIGGFAGIGEREVLIGLDALVWDGDRVIARLTEDQFGSLPTWD
jgi:sporulation protein YlmC with PRC-barrel domain